MTKNVSGGKRAKGFARKHLSGGGGGGAGRLRLPTCDLEQVGVVVKMNGNGMFFVRISTGQDLLGQIRGRFRGRSKRDNYVCMGAIVLVGLREWEGDTISKCDLLEVYTSDESAALSASLDLSWTIGVVSSGGTHGSATDGVGGDDFVFSSETGCKLPEDDDNEDGPTTSNTKSDTATYIGDINVDDI